VSKEDGLSQKTTTEQKESNETAETEDLSRANVDSQKDKKSTDIMIERPQKDAGGAPDKLILELKQRSQNAPRNSNLSFTTPKALPFREIVQNERARKQKIDNDNLESDQRLKSRSLVALFIFLAAETILVFLLAFAQGYKHHGFYLDEWSLRIIIVATLGQITAMLSIAVKHLFPNNKVARKQ